MPVTHSSDFAKPQKTLEDYISLPLVNLTMAGQVFAKEEGEDEEMADCRNDLWQGVVRDLSADLERVLSLLDAESFADKEEGRKLMHRVAGYTGNVGIYRLSVVLRDAMKGVVNVQHHPWLPSKMREWAAASLDEIRKQFPHLPC